MPAADSAPGECFSVARYRLLHHTAVSFVSSDIRVFLIDRKRQRRAAFLLTTQGNTEAGT